jgi:hypothetical protein
MKKFCGLLFLNYIFCLAAAAQTFVLPQASGTTFLGLSYAQPIGGFQKIYPGGNALGGNFGLLVKPYRHARYLEVGAQVGYLVDGIHKTMVNDSYGNYTLKTAHSYIPIHAVARLKPQKQMFLVPYLDGLMGIGIYNTRSKIKQDFFTFLRNNEEAIVLNKHNTSVFSYGLAAGLQFGNRKNHSSLRGDIRLVYLENPITTYVKNGNLFIGQDGYPSYKYSFSETSMLLLQLNLVGLIYRSE